MNAQLLGQTLYALRTARGMSLRETARQLHISPRTLKRLEEGHIGPRLTTDVLFQAADLFQIHARDLFTLE